MTDLEELRAQSDNYRAQRAEALAADVAVWERAAVLIQRLGPAAVLDVAGWSDSLPLMCVALAAAVDTQEEAEGWRELMFMPRDLVLSVSRVLAKRSLR